MPCLEADPLLKGLWTLSTGRDLLERAKRKKRGAPAALERVP